MTEDLEVRRSDDAYGRLPQSIRDRYTRKNYSWLPNRLKDRLVQLETEPEVE